MPLNVAAIAGYIVAAKTVIEGLDQVGKSLARKYGFIHQAWPARMQGKNGYLIWDYVLYNEITFLPDDGSDVVRFHHSFSDDETRAEFEKLVRQFGVT